jgi:hypothetical protein
MRQLVPIESWQALTTNSLRWPCNTTRYRQRILPWKMQDSAGFAAGVNGKRCWTWDIIDAPSQLVNDVPTRGADGFYDGLAQLDELARGGEDFALRQILHRLHHKLDVDAVANVFG